MTTSNWIHNLLVSKSNDDKIELDVLMPPSTFYTPGDIITTDASSFICGHGTFLDKKSGTICSSVAGNVEYINKLVRVIPPKTRYLGEVGDVVIGRVVKVCQRKWVIDLHAQQPASLQLAAIYLPGGIQRRKLEEDELQIRQFFVEGDLLSAEVQSVHYDGSVSIHTRSVKYGKLCNGIFLMINPKNIQRAKSHFLSLFCGVDLILGVNGFIWISLPIDTQSRLNTADIVDGNPYALPNRTLSNDERLLLSRIRNCLIILDKHGIAISENSIQRCFEISQTFDVSTMLNTKSTNLIAAQLT